MKLSFVHFIYPDGNRVAVNIAHIAFIIEAYKGDNQLTCIHTTDDGKSAFVVELPYAQVMDLLNGIHTGRTIYLLDEDE